MATLSLDAGCNSLRLQTSTFDEVRAFSQLDHSRLLELQTAYDGAVEHDDEAALLVLGRELGVWLDGDQRWLARMLEHEVPPLLFEVVAPRRLEPGNLALLEAPWEILADQHGYLVGDHLTQLAPIRRIGEKAEPLGQQRGALTVLFMAASPRNITELDFESEEARILDATRGLPLDLFVEESGSASELGRQALRLAAGDNTVHVVHLTCHGEHTPAPRLLLEDETGAAAATSAAELQNALGGLGKQVGLVFLSACETAAQRNVTKADSLALDLVRSGSVAVLGWAAPVGDVSAIRFAAKLYERLARGDTDLEVAVAEARRMLLVDGDHTSPWHLSRLFLGPGGGGRLSELDGARRKTSAIHETFLAGDRRIPVAGPDEFVGRRRILQRAIRMLREDGIAGVLLHGAGGLGKSSVAARVVDRMSTHTTVVLYGHFVHMQVIDSVAAKLGVVETWRKHWRGRNGETGPALRELLMARDCRLLLVLDDFEQMLEARKDGLHVVRAEKLEMVQGIVHAFAHVNSRSRLLITSRFEFDLVDQTGNPLAKRLTAIPLASFTNSETHKRIRRESGLATKLQELRMRCGQASHGNPTLLSLLLRRVAVDPAGCEQLMTQAEGLATGANLDDVELATQLHQLALGDLCSALSAEERTILQASLLFDVPVPVEVIPVMRRASQLSIEIEERRLAAFGVWDIFPDIANPEHRALLPNRLVAQWAIRLGLPKPEENWRAAVMRAVLPILRNAWINIHDRLDDGDCLRAGHCVACIALEFGDPDTLARFARLAVSWSSLTADVDETRSFARSIVKSLQNSGQLTDARLLVQVANIYETAPDGAFWGWCLEQAASLAKSLPIADVAALQVELSRLERRRGQLDTALRHLDLAINLCEELGMERELAIARGEVADILFKRGDLDGALLILRQALPIYHRLGDIHSLAASTGTIADILAEQCKFDEALDILLRDVLPAFDRLGDIRSRAVVMGKIAGILFMRGDFDEALDLLQQELAICDRVGDVRSRAIALGSIADILFVRGSVDEALRIRQEQELPVFEQLGDVRSRAVTMGRIADILYSRGDFDEALRIRREEELPIYERLDDVRERAITLGKITKILSRRGQNDDALRILRQDVLPALERLGDRRLRAMMFGQIADILFTRSEFGEALRIRQEEELPVYEQTGDFRSWVIALGCVADIHYVRSEYNEALRIRQEQELPLYVRLREVRSQAITWGKIADILCMRGEFDEAFRIRHEEELPVYQQIGDNGELATVRGKIAGILYIWGRFDEALHIRQNLELPAYEQMGDVRQQAMTMLNVADILLVKGDRDEAFRIYTAQLVVFEQIGDIHSRVATLVRIANILVARGQLDQALRIHEEEVLLVCEQCGDVRQRAMVLGKIADIWFRRGDIDEAVRILEDEELPIYNLLGDVRSLALAQMRLAKYLVDRGRSEDQEQIRFLLTASLTEARRLRLYQVEEIENVVRQIGEDPSSPSLL